MSYQLIHIAPHHGSELSQRELRLHGISPDLPEDIQTRLTQFSRDAIHLLSDTPCRHFSYQLIGEPALWHHALTTYVVTEQKHIIIHHLVLTSAEVDALLTNSVRPTPASVTLAINSLPEWQQYDYSSTQYHHITTVPRITAAQLPDASVQATWKDLTGHKRNATALISPPYQRQCHLQISPDCSPVTALQLIHESTWLSTGRGWGRTFSTIDIPGVDIRALSATPSPHMPALVVAPGLDFHAALTEDCPTCGTTAAELPPETQPSEPYKYTEASVEDTYCLPPMQNAKWRSVRYILSLLTLLFGVYFIVSYFADFAADVMPESISREEMKEYAVTKLSALVQQDGYHDEELRKLTELMQQHSRDPESHCLMQCLETLQHQSTTAYEIVSDARILLLNAQKIEFNELQLVRFYLLRMCRLVPVEEWVNTQTRRTNLKYWNHLFRILPHLKDELRMHQLLSPYMIPIIDKVEKEFR